MKSPHEFPETPWTMIREAALTDAPGARDALAELCRCYWYPMYVFVRRSGQSEDDAQDTVQGFFARFLEKNYLRRLDPEAGRFRSYLLGALKHHMSTERQRAAAQKRRGTLLPLEIDGRQAESRYRVEPAATDDPEREFMRKWALALLDHVLDRLEAEYEHSGRGAEFGVLKRFLPGSSDEPSYEHAAGVAGVGVGAMRTRVSRVRARYRELLRRHVARTVDDPEDVTAEIRLLADVIGVS